MVLQTAATLSETALILATQQTFSRIAAARPPYCYICGQNFQNCTWKLQIHPNPTFSRNGKRIYFNHPVSENRTEACFVEIDDLLK